MDQSRRQLMMRMLFGSGMWGLRSLATGIPAAFFANPRLALAGGNCAAGLTPQFLILSTSGSGDPVNANVPGSYQDPAILHPQDPSMAATALTLGSVQTTAALPWSTLPGNVLARSSFMHHASGTVVHTDETRTLELGSGVQYNDMMVSAFAAQLAPCLGTIQNTPIALGNEPLSAQGVPLPLLPPRSLAALLSSPTGPLGTLEARRSADLQLLSSALNAQATPGQQQFLNQYVQSQQDIKNISQSLLSQLSSIKDNSVASQITAAVVLIQMKVAPVITIHIPFGGDNHRDANLANETAQTVSGVASIGTLMSQLAKAGLQDQVTFALLNVFGRTLSTVAGYAGRNHNGAHNVGIMIGRYVQGSVIGGAVVNDGVNKNNQNFGSGHDSALPINSTTGSGEHAGDITLSTSLPSFGKTLGRAVGVNATELDTIIPSGKAVAAALNGV